MDPVNTLERGGRFQVRNGEHSLLWKIPVPALEFFILRDIEDLTSLYHPIIDAQFAAIRSKQGDRGKRLGFQVGGAEVDGDILWKAIRLVIKREVDVYLLAG
jgi:hypothetical protein